MSNASSNKTVLGTDCRLTGELSLDSDAVIMGHFKGVLRVSGMLEITESAHVSGTIIAGGARLAGAIDAQVIRIAGALEITNTAKVSGTILTGTLRLAGAAEADVIAEHGTELLPGAQLNGQLYTTTLAVVEGAVFQGEVCVGPKAMQNAAALLSEIDQAAASPGTPAAETTQPAEEPAPQWEEAAEPTEPATQPVQTVSASLNNMLQRRRARILSASGGVRPLATGNIHGAQRQP
ncbi:MAG: polymer-forming cytoskeletal protein [Planctomycetes bacterium]|nr:polymer-forming cytoskeletal protein [Planctomycetota bacterium]